MFITHKDLTAISEYYNDSGAISLYIYSSLNDTVRDFTTRLESLFDEMEKEIGHGDKRRPIVKDASHIESARNALIENFTKNKRKTYCLFIAEDFYRYIELPIRIKDRIVVADNFYTVPLFIMIDQFKRYAILLFNRRTARLFNYYLGNLREETIIFHSWVMSHDIALKGKTAAHKVEETFHRHLKELSGVLFMDFKRHGFDSLIIGSHADEVNVIKGYLHSYVSSKLVGEIIADPDEDPGLIDKKIRLAIEKHRREIEVEKTDQLIAQAAHGKAALGISQVMEALMLDNVRELVLSVDFHDEGHVCHDRHFVEVKGTSDDKCPYCQNVMRKEPFLEDELAEETFLHGGQVFHIFYPGEKIGPPSIGAFLRRSVV